MSVKTIVFPSDYFSADKPDEELREEYQTALDTGFDAVIFNYEKWFGNEKLALNSAPEAPCRAVYRGFMMKPETYGKFYEKLREKNIILITAPEEYEKFHVFPNIYPELEGDTARAVFFPEGEKPNIEKVKKIFPRFMVKDFVKSVKGTSFPKYFDASVTQEEFDRQMEIFYKYRGELFTGGICIKEFLELKKYGSHTNEYRVFYAKNKPLSVSRNSLQPEYAPAPPEKLTEKYRGLGSPFYTIDYAETRSGEWKIIEAGDGQVSGLSPGQEPSSFFKALFYCVN